MISVLQGAHEHHEFITVNVGKIIIDKIINIIDCLYIIWNNNYIKLEFSGDNVASQPILSLRWRWYGLRWTCIEISCNYLMQEIKIGLKKLQKHIKFPGTKDFLVLISVLEKECLTLFDAISNHTLRRLGRRNSLIKF